LRKTVRIAGVALAVLGASAARAQADAGVFVANTNLQSLAVRVTDKQGRDAQGLKASDFTVLEDGHVQKIAFFAAENQPISVAVLLDTSFSMKAARKLDRAQALLSRLLRADFPSDEMYFTPFTNLVGPFRQLTPAERAQQAKLPELTVPSASEGTALYDALATTLCNMRSAHNARQAVIVITDGADQHSRLRLDQLISLAEASRPQIFMIGFFDPDEYARYKDSGKTVTLVNGQALDNPLTAFERMAKESGAEAFFPSSDQDLSRVLDHILSVLQAEYTLAYYPESVQKLRLIRVKVNHGGLNVTARRAVGSAEAGEEPVHFAANSCAVSPAEHPYPWAPHVTASSLAHRSVYRDDFADARSGWPDHPGSRYAGGGYEINPDAEAKSAPVVPVGQGRYLSSIQRGAVGMIAAYGPAFENFRASVAVSGRWTEGGGGLVFRLNEAGTYLLLLSATGSTPHMQFKLVRRGWNQIETPIIPWTEVSRNTGGSNGSSSIASSTITVECEGAQITVLIDGKQVASTSDASFSIGQVGMAVFGHGRGAFHDFKVEEQP
jgi:Ca-activated chloride channel family protein